MADARVIVSRIAHQHLVAGIEGELLDPLVDVEIERIADVAHQQDDGARRLAAEIDRLLVGHEAGGLDRAEHPLARVRPDGLRPR